jgi:uncharacterized protein (TIGR03437 family)
MMRFVTRLCSAFALALLITAGAQAVTVSSNFSLTGSAPITGTSLVITGQATMSGVYTGNGAFSGTVSLTGSTPTSPNYTITVSAGNTLTGIFTFASAALSGTDTGSLTITGGTGTYAGYTTSTAFSLTETGSTSISGTSVSLTLNCSGSGTVNTSGGGTTTPTPTIAAVQDAASNTPNIAEGSYFSVYGSNLHPSTQGIGLPYPWLQVSNAVKVTFTPTTGATGTDAYLVYVRADQINAILPSTVLVGSYNVTVTNGTVSAQFPTQVVASKLGLFTQDQSGTGLAVVQNYISQSEVDVNRLTTGVYNTFLSSPAKPGQTLIAWGTGLGPYAAADDTAGIVHDFRGSLTIAAVVGGVSIPVDFAGRAGYAAIDQINFALPSNVPTGCAVTLQISVNGVLSATTYISIAPSTSATACVQPGYTTQQLQDFDKGVTITTGGFSLTQFALTVPPYGTLKYDSISGSFTQITGFQLAASSTRNAGVTTSGSCVVVPSTCNGTVAATHVTNLDAGTVTLTGPAGTNLTNQKLTEDASYGYNYTIGTEGITIPGQTSSSTILPGTYTLTGAGGTDVGSFNPSIQLGSPLTLNSPLPATVTESAGLTLNWTGGNASDVVQIFGYSGTGCGTGANQVTNAAAFYCTTTAGQRTFTVPASILTRLPTVTAAQITAGTASGFLDVTSGPTPVSFSPTLTKGGTVPSVFSSLIGVGSTVAYQ